MPLCSVWPIWRLMMMMHFLERLCVEVAKVLWLCDWRNEKESSPWRTRLLAQRCRYFLELWTWGRFWVCSAPWLQAPPLASQ